MVFGLLPACGGGEITPTGTGGPTPTSAGEIFNWRWQSTALAGTPTYWTYEEYASNVKTATGGRLNFELQPQGAIVGTNEIFDAVSSGAIEVGSGCD